MRIKWFLYGCAAYADEIDMKRLRMSAGVKEQTRAIGGVGMR